MGDARRDIRVRLLGGLVVDGIDEHALGSRKARTLLKRLAVAHGRVVTSDELIDVVWASAVPGRPNDQLGVLVSRLRRVLGAETIVHRDAGYRLDVDWLDLDELSARVDEADSAYTEGRFAAARTAASAATSLGRERLLPDDEGPWLDAERAWCEMLVGRAHRIAADAALSAGDTNAASASAEAALLSDPYDESALRTLMRAHAAAGRPASGLAAYVRLRERLGDDLGVVPTAETERLHDELVLGSLDPDTSGDEGVVAPTILGRDRELDVLDAALDRARHGAAVTVMVGGEAGIGKTALLDAWTGSVGPATVVVRCQCDPLGRDLPLQPLIDGVARHIDALGPAGAELIGDAGSTLARLLGSAPGLLETSGDPELGRAHLFTALLSVVERLADGAVVVVVEDTHHAGASTYEWISFAMRRGHRLLVVATSRHIGRAIPGAESLEVGALPVEVATQLVGDVGDSGLATEIVARAGGNPLFLLALAESAGGDLPASIREAVDRQVDMLGPATETVRAAAIIGGEIDLDLLADVIAIPAVTVLADLETACRIGLLEERSSRFGFRHELVREALDTSAGSARRAMVHRDVARVLRNRSVDDPLGVAVHARLGGETSLAVDAYVSAARAAFNRYDVEAALQHVDSALALAPDASAHAVRARVRMATLDLGGAELDATEAIALGGGSQALEVAAWVAYYLRHYAEARAYADAGAELASESVIELSCRAVGGRVRHGAGDLAGAEEQLEARLGTASGGRGAADVWLAHLRVHQGRPNDALEAAQRALIDADRLGQPWAGLHGRMARVMALGQLGRVDEALAGCDQLEEARRRLGAVGARFEGIAANTRGWLLRNVGNLTPADESNQQALAAHAEQARLSEIGLTEAYWVALLDLVDGRLIAGDLDGANRRLGDAVGLDDWQGTMAWHQRHRLGLLRARAAIMGGDPESAWPLAEAVRVDAAERGARRYELLASAVVARCDPSLDAAAVAPTIEGLQSCARLESWRLAAELARQYDVDAWRVLAEQTAGAVIAAAGPHQATARRWVERTLSAASTM